MESFTQLEAWKKGMELVKEICAITKFFPKEEQFGLTSQVKRSVTGILANLAEGYSRQTSADKAYKYTVARGECSETRAFLLMAIELEFISEDKANTAMNLAITVGKLLTGLIQKFSSQP